MRVRDVRRWQWLVLGALVGLLLWGMHRPGGAGLALEGECINDQRTFEQRLMKSIAGRPLFADVKVSRHRAVAAPGRVEEVYLISGTSCDGAVREDGKYHWGPAFFVARAPYHPATLPAPAGSDGSKVAQRWERLERPTVIDFLRLAEAAGGPGFTVAWWDTYPFAAWFGGAVFLIGIVWPCVIDLIVFGRLVRPRARSVPGRMTTVAEPPATASPLENSELLHALEQQAAATQPGAAPVRHGGTGASPVRPLEAAPVSAVPEAATAAKTFKAKAEDFYPTEDRTVRPRGCSA
jgi:hypothetical protein